MSYNNRVFERTCTIAFNSSSEPLRDSFVVSVDFFDAVSDECICVISSVAIVNNTSDRQIQFFAYERFDFDACSRTDFQRISADSVEIFAIFFNDDTTSRELYCISSF